MLPITWHILSAGIARRLLKASLLARDRGDYEVTAILYVKGKRIEGLRMLKNFRKEAGKFECKGEEYDKAIAMAPSWATAHLFFHSHPISDEPSRSDVLSARSGNQMIFECSSRSFYLYQYSRKLRKVAKKEGEWKFASNEIRSCTLPLYVETGVKSFDATILKGEVHKRFKGTLRRYLYEFLQGIVQGMDSRGCVVIPHRFTLDREYALDQLFGGLEYYVQFPQHEAPKKKLVEIGFLDEDFIVSAYSIFYQLNSYTISQQKE